MSRLPLRHLLVGLPVLLVWAVLSVAAVVGLVRSPTPSFTTVDFTAAAPVDRAAPEEEPAAAPSQRPDHSFLGGLPPRELPDVGTYTISTIRSDGRIEVVEWLRTDEPTTTITLDMPLGSPDSTTAQDVSVIADTGPAAGPEQVTSSGSYSAELPSEVFLARYILSGATRVGQTSSTRGLVRPVALGIDVEDDTLDGPAVLAIRAARVLALACSIPGDETTLTPCGAPATTGWRVDFDQPDRSTLVAAQVELD